MGPTSLWRDGRKLNGSLQKGRHARDSVDQVIVRRMGDMVMAVVAAGIVMQAGRVLGVVRPGPEVLLLHQVNRHTENTNSKGKRNDPQSEASLLWLLGSAHGRCTEVYQARGARRKASRVYAAFGPVVSQKLKSQGFWLVHRLD